MSLTGQDDHTLNSRSLQHITPFTKNEHTPDHPEVSARGEPALIAFSFTFIVASAKNLNQIASGCIRITPNFRRYPPNCNHFNARSSFFTTPENRIGAGDTLLF